ncbi:MAG: ATP-binding protein [Gammaproteobacteria bacterium]|nr:ATP-binding protein [Gammaproteobacteria bacterium]
MMNKTAPFVGREPELKELRKFFNKKSSSLIVVKGRRRIGKSRLIEEFARDCEFYQFSGLPPTDKSTAQSQRDEFSRQLSEQTGLPELQSDDWSKLFYLLAEKVKKSRVVLLFDEISWMGSEDSDFLGKIKNAWDIKFKKNPNLIFVLCGSASYWIEENILSSTGFLGRVSYTLTLDELPLKACDQFWGKTAKNISAYEKFKILSVTGGIPRYLEEIDPHLSAEENIKQLCFKKGGILVNEFEHIFSNIFKRRTPLYREIIEALVYGTKDASEISKELKVELTGLFSEYFKELSLSGFIRRDYTWNINTGQDSKLSKYRLSDNYLRFYLRYIEKYKTKIDRSGFELKSLTSLPELPTIMGLQFENLVLNNRRYIYEVLGVSPDDVVSENPFFQTPTSRQPGCQIDYLIQTKFNTLYICEIKFSKNAIGMDVIHEVQQKIDRLKRPKGFSCRPVLIHVNGISEDVAESNYFSSIVDMGMFF